ncbi:MAG: flagellar hook-length control protein FliK [bacterium]|nr:flagellar hook-length control protein FliK [bacterium]
MPELNVSMAGAKLAIEIKAADPVSVPKLSKTEFQVRSSEPETFDRVLERAEQKNPQSVSNEAQTRGSMGESRQAGHSKAVDESEKDKSRPEEESARSSDQDDSAMGTGASTVPVHKDEASQHETAKATEVVSSSGGKSDGSQPTSQGTGSEIHNAAINYLFANMNILRGSQALAGLDSNSAESGNPGLQSTGTDLSQLLSNPLGIPDLTGDEIVPIDDRTQVNVGSKTDVIQQSDVRDKITVRQPVETPVNNQLRIDPSTISAAKSIPESQWTNMLEIDELLNPTLRGNSNGTEQRIPISRQAVDIAPTVRETGSEVSPTPRINEQSRFEWRQPENNNPRLIENVWAQQSKPETAQQAAIQDTLFRLSNVIRPLVDSPGQNLQQGSVVETPSVGQLASIVRAQAILADKSSVRTEALVSDVRDAVMRIASDGRGEARLVLNPPELGELVVRIESAKNGVVRAEFHTISPLVRDSLEAGIQRLTDALKAQGLTLEQAYVHLDFGLGTQDESGQANSNRNGSGFNRNVNDPELSSAQINSNLAAEWMPEGSTISVLA